MIKFTSRPAFNKAAKWRPTNMQVDGLRVWTCQDKDAMANLHRVGRYGDRYFYSWSQNQVPNYISHRN